MTPKNLSSKGFQRTCHQFIKNINKKTLHNMSNKKKERVYIRLTTDEKLSLIANAERYGTSISDLVRKKLLQPSAIFLDEKERVELKNRKSTRLNSSHVRTSYAVFCLKKKKLQ